MQESEFGISNLCEQLSKDTVEFNNDFMILVPALLSISNSSFF
jgi:hypothetical protein